MATGKTNAAGQSSADGIIKEIEPEQFYSSVTAFVIIEFEGNAYIASHRTLFSDIVYALGDIVLQVFISETSCSVSLTDMARYGTIYSGSYTNGTFSEEKYYGSSAHYYDFI